MGVPAAVLLLAGVLGLQLGQQVKGLLGTEHGHGGRVFLRDLDRSLVGRGGDLVAVLAELRRTNRELSEQLMVLRAERRLLRENWRLRGLGPGPSSLP
ncbi:hypothetical protein [Streptacidiphilus sp. PAMC 29251]